jgi:hypothetical protein
VTNKSYQSSEVSNQHNVKSERESFNITHHTSSCFFHLSSTSTALLINMTINEITWTDNAAEKGTTVSKPHFGGIMTLDSDGKTLIFAWSGSDPDSETQCFTYNKTDQTWVYPEKDNYDTTKPHRKGAEHIGMYRMPGFKYSTKIKETCTSFTGTLPYNGITPKDASPIMTLTSYKQSTLRHMIINGLYDIFVIINPAGKKFDLFSSHSLFLEDDIKEHVLKLRATGCLLVIENLMYSGTYLRNSIDAALYQKVIEDSGVNATGPEVFGSLMKILYSNSFEAIDQCRAALKTINLSDFPGENVELCCSKIELLAERLDCAGAFDMDQLLIVVKIMEGAADERFCAWATTQFRHFNDIAKKLRVYHVSTLKDPMPRWDTFLKECRVEYREMIGQQRWTPQVDAGQQSPLEPTLPAAYLMRAMMASLQQMGINGNDPNTIQALVLDICNNKATTILVSTPAENAFVVAPLTMSLQTALPLIPKAKVVRRNNRDATVGNWSHQPLGLKLVPPH